MSRIRHCVECPRCHTRYLVSFSPYRNGAYLIPAVKGSLEEYILYCVCSGRAATRWKWSDVLACDVSRAAYERGYGAPAEVMLIVNQSNESWSIGRYIDDWKSFERGKNLP